MSAAASGTAAAPSGERLKFVEIVPTIDVDFWFELEHQKLEHWRLTEPTVLLQPTVVHPSRRGILRAHHNANAIDLRKTSFVSSSTDVAVAGKVEQPTKNLAFPLALLNFNTPQQYQGVTKANEQDRYKAIILKAIEDGTCWSATTTTAGQLFPVPLLPAMMHTFADLKTHKFHYMMSFPSLDIGLACRVAARRHASEHWGTAAHRVWESIQQYASTVHDRRHEYEWLLPFEVIVQGTDQSVECLPLTQASVKALPAAAAATAAGTPISGATSHVIAMWDLSASAEFPGWMWRTVLGALRLTHKKLTSVTILAMRETVEASVVWTLNLDALPDDFSTDAAPAPTTSSSGKPSKGGLKVVGVADVESNSTIIDMASMMDPKRLAESSARLNLSLVKWRMLPTLDLTRLSQCKALILGSGTLGCNIARHLMMWGVMNLTLVDRGSVSYSNPVRQSLFELNDCLQEGDARIKCIAAARTLKRILPSVNAVGIPLTIRMPGHRIDGDAKSLAEAKHDVEKLEQLICQHDVVFLLTDSRESRWLPTLLCAVHDKPVINSALGFDSYMVMRHGVNGTGFEHLGAAAPATTTTTTTAAASGATSAATVTLEGHGGKVKVNPKRVGCYFCNDIVAPVDSLTARTLDQQCTVTRPGVSAMASALAVELLASVYNHPKGFACPAHIDDADDDDEHNTRNPLGSVPHQIRGNVNTWEQMILHGQQYNQCTACSDVMIEAYRKGGFEFVKECLNRPAYMEEVSGLAQMKADMEGKHADWDGDDDDE